MLKQWVKRKKRGTKKKENKPRWEADYELVENEGLFQEYLEMSEYKKIPHGYMLRSTPHYCPSSLLSSQRFSSIL